VGHKPHKEIERKFLIKKLPKNFRKFPKNSVWQGYIVIMPDMKSFVRLRREGGLYSQTIKRGSGKIRDEYEITLTPAQFKSLWLTTEGRRVRKTRYYIKSGKETIILDIFHGPLKGLIMVEVEFRTEKECDAFIPPKWFGKEVTEDRRYSNQSLATNGLPTSASENLTKRGAL